jgi:hypothetical protein
MVMGHGSVLPRASTGSSPGHPRHVTRSTPVGEPAAVVTASTRRARGRAFFGSRTLRAGASERPRASPQPDRGAIGPVLAQFATEGSAGSGEGAAGVEGMAPAPGVSGAGGRDARI